MTADLFSHAPDLWKYGKVKY